MSRLAISRGALDLIESFEGFRAKSASLNNGKYTIGFGHSATAREGMTITREQAEELLRWDLRPVEDFVRGACHAPLNQNQYDALVSFAFNIGIENFAKSETLRHVNQGEPVAAAIAMSAWRRASLNGRTIIVDALVRRRYAEVSMFFETPGARPAAPSCVVAPELDYSAALLAPNSDSIKEIMASKTNGEFVVRGEIPQIATADENAINIEPAIVTMPNMANQSQQITTQDLLPFPDDQALRTKREQEAPVLAQENGIVAANQPIAPLTNAANDDKPAPKEPQKAQAQTVFEGRGMKIQAPTPSSQLWLKYLPWIVAFAGLLAFVYGLLQIDKLQLLELYNSAKISGTSNTIGAEGFRAILITLSGFAALVLSILSYFDETQETSN